MPLADRTTLNNLTLNLDIGDVADPALRLAYFQYMTDLSDANYNYVLSLVASSALSPYPPAQYNNLINGNFDIWQRGTSVTNLAENNYLADHWQNRISADSGTLPSNIIHSRQQLTSGDIANAYYFYRIAPDGAGSSLGVNAYGRLDQKIENGTRLLCGSGKEVTVSFWARSSISAKRLGVSLTQYYGLGGSPSSTETVNGTNFALTSAWVKYTYTFTTNTLVGKTFGTSNDDWIRISFNYMWGSSGSAAVGSATAETFVGAGNIDIAQVQVCAGDVALPFQPRTFAEELALCQRYYEKSYDYTVVPGTATTTGQVIGQASNAVSASIAGTLILPSHDLFKVPKRTTPTTTLYSTDGTANAILVSGATNRTGCTATGSCQKKPLDFITISNASATSIADRVQIQYQWKAEDEI